MFNKKTKEEHPGLDEAIELVLTELKQYPPTSAEYATIVTQLEKLYKLKTISKVDTVSKDGMLAVAGNLAGIGMILSYERVHVVTSKALGFIMKSRV